MEKRIGDHLPCLCKDSGFTRAYDECIDNSGECKHLPNLEDGEKGGLMDFQVKTRRTSRKGRTVENIFVMGNIRSEGCWWKERGGGKEAGDVCDGGDTVGGLDYYGTYLSATTVWW